MPARALAVLGAVVACVAGCSSTGEGNRVPGTSAGPGGGSATGSAGGQPAGSSQPSAAPGPPGASAAPSATRVSVSDGSCPYLGEDFVEATVGQRIASVVVTTTEPPSGPRPQCEFVRADGDVAVSVRTRAVAPGAGLAAALAEVPGGNPANAGEGGSVRVDSAQSRTDLAAWAGTALVVVTLNQASSLEAVEIAKAVLEGL
ncbi:DUF2020 domain-containing protein [Cumulibacter manganitolerans]|uniref:DUF2020 domain-containing protein n=1 Tax=Cumulibacter manganitolerans TaxID=1884992 RepID=UPI001E44E066|nr:DUF2020 domain-containing protein [Cumulibacter manganitolerans]